MSYEHYIVKSYNDGSVSFFGEDGLIDLVVGKSKPPAIFDYLDLLPADCDLVIEDHQKSILMPIAQMSDYELYNHYNEFDACSSNKSDDYIIVDWFPSEDYDEWEEEPSLDFLKSIFDSDFGVDHV
jgi:hypothetical protein